jgi:16S rRNA (adenine1518-N6/adenine1519-N6)-dimethyltransferase
MLQHKAKRSLGQNFLTSKDIVRKMSEVGEVNSKDTVLEIGPGKGVLTEILLESGAKVIAVEKDDELFEYLKEKFSVEIASGQLSLLHGDIGDLQDSLTLPIDYKLIANIPYNITGKIISDFLSRKDKPSKMVLMLQYEVADRIAARNDKKSILSLSVDVYGQPKLVRRVPAGAFNPKPKVDSAILLIDKITSEFFDSFKISEKIFFDLLHAGFAHKRKKLIRNIIEVFPNTDWFYVFKTLELDENTRAENISKETWGFLSQHIK